MARHRAGPVACAVSQLYVNAGMGYHSNDARGSTITRDPASGEAAEPVTPLVRAKGAEAGFRTIAIPRMQSTVAVWWLDLDSELLFVGDAGTTESGRPSRRYGIEWTNYARLTPVLTADADLAWSRARFTDDDPAGTLIPGATEAIASLGLTLDRSQGLFGSVRLRYFGGRPLVEDDSVRSEATSLTNVQVGWHLTPRMHVVSTSSMCSTPRQATLTTSMRRDCRASRPPAWTTPTRIQRRHAPGES